jgi:hypothetical protein
MSSNFVTGGDPSDDEMAAIAAAVAVLWPRQVVASPARVDAEPDRWRFSGRWWSKPVPIRRERPAHYQ